MSRKKLKMINSLIAKTLCLLLQYKSSTVELHHEFENQKERKKERDIGNVDMAPVNSQLIGADWGK
jgi:hypothetical protein